MSQMTTTEVANELGISERRVRALIGSNRLPAVKIGRDWIVERKDLELVRDRKPGKPSKNKESELIIPENKISDTIADIRIENGSICVYFPEKRRDFWDIIKPKLRYEWINGCWKRIFENTDIIPDRATETAIKLLAAGFCVRIADEIIRKKVAANNYIPECKRWIKAIISGEYKGYFAISWDGYNDTLYNAAKRITGARWNEGSMVAPAEYFEDVQDFAEMYGFEFSDAAQSLIIKAKKAREEALTIKVKPQETTDDYYSDKPVTLDIPEEVDIDVEFKD